MHSKIKLLRRLFAGAIVASAAAVASAMLPTVSPSLDENALENYLQTITLQMQTYRWEIDASARAVPAGDERLVRATHLVQRGEELILRMRSSHPMEIIALRGEYEKVRAELDRVFGRDQVAAW
jgi:hypothetical protein